MTEQIFTDEQIQAWQAAVQSLNKTGRQWIVAMQPAIEQAAYALQTWGIALADWAEIALPGARDFIEYATPDDIPEQTLRDYAAHYNAAHPGRRISWRRLNRHQRAEAFWKDF